MADFEDDQKPLMSFNRDSSFRRATRRKPDAYPQLHGKPPLPRPRLADYVQVSNSRLRSQSATEGEENRVPDTAVPQYGATQTLDSNDYWSERRFCHQHLRNTTNARLTTQRNGQSHTDESNVSSRQRNDNLSASLPCRRKSRSFIEKIFSFSPLTTRRAMPDCSISDRDASVNSRLFNQSEMSTKSYRREKTARPMFLAADFPDKATSINEQSGCSLTRHNSTQAGKRNQPQKKESNIAERSTSFRQQRAPFDMDGWSEVTVHQAERLCNNTLPSSTVENKGGWRPEAPLVNRKDLNSDRRQRGTLGVRRHSSLPRPGLARSNSDVVSVAFDLCLTIKITEFPLLENFFHLTPHQSSNSIYSQMTFIRFFNRKKYTKFFSFFLRQFESVYKEE